MKKIIITTGVIAIAGGIATALLMPSCQDDCEFLPSLIVSMVNRDGGSVGVDFAAGDSVWYNWTDDETGKKITGTGECANEDCSEWTIDASKPGTYEVHATVCGSQYDSSVVFEVDEYGCVLDKNIVNMPIDTAACTNVRPPDPQGSGPGDAAKSDLKLASCTLEARFSVIAPVWAQYGDMMVPVPADRVFYSWDGEPNNRELPGKCMNEDCTAFTAGLEQTGEFVLGAEVCGKTWRTSTTVGKTDDGCHVQTQHAAVIVDPQQCDKPLELEPPEQLEGQTCQPQLWPSAIVIPVEDGGDVWLPHPTEKLMYINDGERNSGYCMEAAAGGKCRLWITGFGRTGRFEAITDGCEAETSVFYTVELAEDGCHPKTEYVPVFVDTRGCILAATPKGSDPGPDPTVPSADQVDKG